MQDDGNTRALCMHGYGLTFSVRKLRPGNA